MDAFNDKPKYVDPHANKTMADIMRERKEAAEAKKLEKMQKMEEEKKDQPKGESIEDR